MSDDLGTGNPFRGGPVDMEGEVVVDHPAFRAFEAWWEGQTDGCEFPDSSLPVDLTPDQREAYVAGWEAKRVHDLRSAAKVPSFVGPVVRQPSQPFLKDGKWQLGHLSDDDLLDRYEIACIRPYAGEASEAQRAAYRAEVRKRLSQAGGS